MNIPDLRDELNSPKTENLSRTPGRQEQTFQICERFLIVFEPRSSVSTVTLLGNWSNLGMEGWRDGKNDRGAEYFTVRSGNQSGCVWLSHSIG